MLLIALHRCGHNDVFGKLAAQLEARACFRSDEAAVHWFIRITRHDVVAKLKMSFFASQLESFACCSRAWAGPLSFFNCLVAVAIRGFRTSMHGHHRCDHVCEWDTAADHQMCTRGQSSVTRGDNAPKAATQRGLLKLGQNCQAKVGALGAMKSRTTPTSRMGHSAPRSRDRRPKAAPAPAAPSHTHMPDLSRRLRLCAVNVGRHLSTFGFIVKACLEASWRHVLVGDRACSLTLPTPYYMALSTHLRIAKSSSDKC